MHGLINTLFDAKLLSSLTAAVRHVFSNSQSLNSYVILIDVSTYQMLAIDAPYQVALPQYLFALKNEGELGVFTLKFIEKIKENQIEGDQVIARFLGKFNSYVSRDNYDIINGLNTNHFQSVLFKATNLPFLDRTDFRAKFYHALNCNKGEVIFVKGEKQSGMSYLKEYFLDVCDKFDFLEFREINVFRYLEVPAAASEQGLHLAKIMAANFNLDTNLGIEEIEDLKFIRFCELLRTKFLKMDKIPLVFIHDFHKITNLLNDVNNFLYELIKRVVETFPKAIFVIAGFSYENLSEWDSDLSNKCEVYEMENISQDDLKNFAAIVYQKYKAKIDKLYKESDTNFEDAFVKRLLPFSKTSVSKLAEVIRSDIKIFESHD
ncbi:hypothetical protein [Aquimarina intermedia]|uniref:AAA ATPase-like protein n=1 Tax=Aquimarina intermedia TaxID=350814 RepID=A0A5S5C7Z1_9FLAO|nr:hypothetical protein [Aquimarina intermedia]TYP75289.1 hypothetical protein BD809_103353 [Aquimarina intermedia]